MNITINKAQTRKVACFQLIYKSYFAETSNPTENNLNKTPESKDEKTDSNQTTKETRNKKSKVPKTKKRLGKKGGKKKPRKS